MANDNISDFIYLEESKKELKKLYPCGFENFFMDSISLESIKGSMDFVLWVMDKPQMPHSQWGVWNKDYNVVILKFRCHLNKKVNVENWANNFIDDHENKCVLNITTEPSKEYGIKDEKDYTLHFSGNNWEAKLITKALIFQEAETCFYLEEAEDLDDL